jgi:uncharacterized damage-inducible protein DinB
MTTPNVITPDTLLAHWQGHRRVTRRLIEAFPEKEMFEHSIGGMRTFASLESEMLSMAVPVARGVATGKWAGERLEFTTREEALSLWDEATTELNNIWKTIPPDRFQAIDTAFGQWEGPGISMILYAIDNEIHHRGQAYVYLRSLGVSPPPFYDRS